MATQVQYQYLEPRPRSHYQQLWVKGRHLRAEVLYRAPSVWSLAPPEEVAQDYELPVEAVQEAIDYAIRNQEVLATERAREASRIQQLGLDQPPFVPTEQSTDACASTWMMTRPSGAWLAPVELMPGMWSWSLPVCSFLGHRMPGILFMRCDTRLVLVTRNHDDFLDLHEVVQTGHGTHPGILIIRFDNDPTRDMTPRHIVTAIARLESAGVPLENQVYILNHWR